MTSTYNYSPEQVRDRLDLFAGGTGGLDSWLTNEHSALVIQRLGQLPRDPLSCGQLNQLLAFAHQGEITPDVFSYYWLLLP